MNLERPFLIGVVHLLPLPGAPGWKGSMESVISRAASDAEACAQGGMNAVIIENFGDSPFFKLAVPPETVAAMARAATAVREVVGDSFPIGFNVLRNDAGAALGLCAACDGSFVRVNIHCGAMVTDQGIIEGEAAATLRKRRELCPDVRLLADVMVKHAEPVGASFDLARAARDTWSRGRADGLIVTGTGTGEETALDDLRTVREAVPDAFLIVGSGATAANVATLLEVADGIIVGSFLKRDGDPLAPVDAERVKEFVEAAENPRRNDT